jgi:hypothetical protein
MKNRARIVSGLAALAALFLAPLAQASLSRVSAAERTIETPALTLTASAPEPSDFSLFEGRELTLAAAESERAPSFHPLAAVSLLSEDGAEAPLVSVDELIYPKTRYRVFELLGTPLLGVERGVSLELRWRCADFSCGFASGTVGWLSQDPLGDVDSPNLYGFVGARPHEKTDPLGLAGGPQNPTASEWAQVQQDADFGNLRPSAMPSRGEASIGGAFHKHSSEIGTVVGGMAVTAATEAVIYYAQGKVAEIGIRLGVRLVLRGATHLFRTLQEATAFARSQGATVRYVEEAASGAPMLSARGTKFEAAAGSTARTSAKSAEELVTWVDEGGNLKAAGSPGMRPDAYRYQSGASGARSKRLTGYGQAPYLEFTDASGATVGAKFDGVNSYELIDRKKNPYFSPKAVDQAFRQAAVARHYGLTAVWELPTQEALDAANRFMRSNNIEGIVVRLARP